MTTVTTVSKSFASWIVRSNRRRADVARELGCDRSMVSHLCAGRATPSLDMAAAIERVCGIPASAWARPVRRRRAA